MRTDPISDDWPQTTNHERFEIRPPPVAEEPRLRRCRRVHARARQPPESNPFRLSVPVNPLCPAQEQCLRRITRASEGAIVAHALTWFSCLRWSVKTARIPATTEPNLRGSFPFFWPLHTFSYLSTISAPRCQERSHHRIALMVLESRWFKPSNGSMKTLITLRKPLPLFSPPP